ncbi:unnamed protein product [Cochlearia groenlandica]
MSIAKENINTKTFQKAFEMVQYFPSSSYQNSYKYCGPKPYTVKEATSSNTGHRVIYHQSNDQHGHYFGASPFNGHANKYEGAKERPISCDEALKRYGGVLIKEFRS